MCFLKGNISCSLEKKCEICFNLSFASHEKEKFWSNKNTIKPYEIKQKSQKKFWFKCDKSEHEFETSLNNVVNGRWCPYPCCCKGGQKKLCIDRDCKICFDFSFASHEKVKSWSDKNEVTPREVFKNSSKKHWFKCDKSDHEFDVSLDHVNRGNWCPYPCCSCKKLCTNKECKICFEASFARIDKAKYWSDKNEISAREVFKNGDSKKFWFKCDKSNHEFDSVLRVITRGNWCPYPCCAKPFKRLCTDKDCKVCFDASFANVNKAKFWSDKNEISAREISKNTHFKYLFKCENEHEFEATVSDVTRDRWWCPECYIWKNEEECKKCLEKLTGKTFKKSRPKCLKGLELDGYNEEMMLAIEYNGKQHYEYDAFFHKKDEENLKRQQERDKLKEELCHLNGIYLITVPYTIKDKEEFITEQFRLYSCRLDQS